MPTNVAISRGRRLAGPAALLTTAAGLAAVALHETQWIEWGLLAFSGVVALAGVGLGRRSMVSQVLSRGTAWTVLAPSFLVTVLSFMSGHGEWTAAGLAATSGAALLLARPMLHTAEAHEQFAPSSFRRWLLAGSTASAMAGVCAGTFGLAAIGWSHGMGVGFLALSLSLLASAAGVVRMRAWGILLGALTSIVTFIVAACLHDAAGFALSLATVPGFMLLLPVLVAKRQRAKAEAAARSSSFTRVSAHVGYDDAPSRIRVATGSSDAFDDDVDPPADEARAERRLAV